MARNSRQETVGAWAYLDGEAGGMSRQHDAGVAGALELAEVARAEEERRTIEQRTGVKMSNAEFAELFGYLIDDAELDERCRLESSRTSRLAERRGRFLDALEERFGA